MIKILVTLTLLLITNAVMAKTIVVLGDSISAGYGIEVAEGWVALIGKKLVASGEDFTIANESISGDTSAGGLARVDAALKTHKPDIVVLELGANDGLRGLSPELMKNNLAEIIRRSQKINAKVLLLGIKIPPNYGKRYMDLFYSIFPQLAHEFKVAFIPFVLEDIALETHLMQADGLHPNAKAQPIMLEKILTSLQPLINETKKQP